MLLLVALAGPASHFLHFRHAWLFAVLFLVLACWRAHLNAQALHATRELIYSAAEACGLIKNSASVEMSPKQLHERALATAGQSGEMYLNKP